MCFWRHEGSRPEPERTPEKGRLRVRQMLRMQKALKMRIPELPGMRVHFWAQLLQDVPQAVLVPMLQARPQVPTGSPRLRKDLPGVPSLSA